MYWWNSLRVRMSKSPNYHFLNFYGLPLVHRLTIDDLFCVFNFTVVSKSVFMNNRYKIWKVLVASWIPIWISTPNKTGLLWIWIQHLIPYFFFQNLFLCFHRTRSGTNHHRDSNKIKTKCYITNHSKQMIKNFTALVMLCLLSYWLLWNNHQKMQTRLLFTNIS